MYFVYDFPTPMKTTVMAMDIIIRPLPCALKLYVILRAVVVIDHK